MVVLALIKYFLKKTNEARNHLKTLSKLVYQPEYAEHFEMGWLMLADFLIAVIAIFYSLIIFLLLYSKENLIKLKSTADFV